MEIKKTVKANLENKKLLFAEVGLAIALLVFWAAIEQNSKIKKSSQNVIVERPEEVIETVPITQVEPPPPETAPKLPVISEIIDIVDNDIDVDDLFLSLEDDPRLGVEINDYYEEVEEEIIEEEAILIYQAEEKPLFQGADANEFSKWVNKRIVYPEEAIQNHVEGRVLIGFTIEKDGKLTNIKVLRSSNNSLLDKEALRVVSTSPQWTPGKQRDRTVRVNYTFPVIFRLR